MDPARTALKTAGLLEVEVLVLEIPSGHARGEFADSVAETRRAVLPDASLDSETHDDLERVLQGGPLFVAPASRPDRMGERPPEARILREHLEEGPGTVVMPAGVKFVMGLLRVAHQRRRIRGHELVRGPVGMALPEPADVTRVTETLGVILDGVRELMRNHAAAVAHRPRVDDDVRRTESEALLVLGQTGPRHEDVQFVRRSLLGHRHGAAERLEVGPDLFIPIFLLIQEAGRESLLAAAVAERAGVEGVMRRGGHFGGLLGIVFEDQGVLGLLLLRQGGPALLLEFFGERPVRRGQEFGRIAAETIVVAEEDEHRRGEFAVFATEFDESPSDLRRPVLHGFGKRLELPGAHLSARRLLTDGGEAERFGFLHAGGQSPGNEEQPSKSETRTHRKTFG